MLNNLKSVLAKAGTIEVSLSYLGGLSMLVKFSSEEECKRMVGEYDRWRLWFSSLDYWMGQSLPFERIAWLKLIGVPIHLATDEVYDAIVGRFGKVIHASQRSADDRDLSFNCIGVLVGDGTRIAESSTLKWKDKVFKVWVEEELAEWIPECIESEESMSAADDMSSQFRLDDRDGIPSVLGKETKDGGNVGWNFEVHASPSGNETSVEREKSGVREDGADQVVGERGNHDIPFLSPNSQEVHKLDGIEVGPHPVIGPTPKQLDSIFISDRQIKIGPTTRRLD
ncbi:hypothetical protein HanPI659440_Chr05g0205811 [Helianthus annuus]|nr:hypothetical protein HanPI659440_Chr05g0205811 [Helianthus annuus]